MRICLPIYISTDGTAGLLMIEHHTFSLAEDEFQLRTRQLKGGRGRASGVIAAQAAGTGDGRRDIAVDLGGLVNPTLRGIVEHEVLLGGKVIPLASLEAPANEAMTQ